MKCTTRDSWTRKRQPFWDFLCRKFEAGFCPVGTGRASPDLFLDSLCAHRLFYIDRQFRCVNCNSISADRHGLKLVYVTFTEIRIADYDLKMALVPLLTRTIRKSVCCNDQLRLDEAFDFMPKFLSVMLPFCEPDSLVGDIKMTERIEVLGHKYRVAGAIRSRHGHFTCIVFRNGRYYELDDLRDVSPNSQCFCELANCGIESVSLNVLQRRSCIWFVLFAHECDLDSLGSQSGSSLLNETSDNVVGPRESEKNEKLMNSIVARRTSGLKRSRNLTESAFSHRSNDSRTSPVISIQKSREQKICETMDCVIEKALLDGENSQTRKGSAEKTDSVRLKRKRKQQPLSKQHRYMKRIRYGAKVDVCIEEVIKKATLAMPVVKGLDIQLDCFEGDEQGLSCVEDDAFAKKFWERIDSTLYICSYCRTVIFAEKVGTFGHENSDAT